MSAGWVAAGVRARGLVGRAIGPDDARDLAASASLRGALELLVQTAYGHDVRADMDLASAERAVSATSLWHVRVLAGWGPPLGAGTLRLLSAGFEIANITGHLARAAGTDVLEPYALGSMAIAWPAVSRATTAAEVRAALAGSAWGDPGSEEPAAIRLALLFGWARRVLDGVPGARDWAVSGAALVLRRAQAAGAMDAIGTQARRDARRVLGSRWADAASVDELVPALPKGAAEVLAGATDDTGLWQAEARWWSGLEAQGARLVASPRPDASSSIGAVGVLAADAWRARAALEVAARGGGDLTALLGTAP